MNKKVISIILIGVFILSSLNVIGKTIIEEAKEEISEDIETNSSENLIGEIFYKFGTQNYIKKYYDQIVIPLLPGQKEEITFVVNWKYVDDPMLFLQDCYFYLMIDPPSGTKADKYVSDPPIEDNSCQGKLKLTETFELSGLEPQYRYIEFGYSDDQGPNEKVQIELLITESETQPGIDITRPIEGLKYVDNKDKGASESGGTEIQGSITITAELPSGWVRGYDVISVNYYIDNQVVGTVYENDFIYEGPTCSASYTWNSSSDNSYHELKVAAFDKFLNEASDTLRIKTIEKKSKDMPSFYNIFEKLPGLNKIMKLL